MNPLIDRYQKTPQYMGVELNYWGWSFLSEDSQSYQYQKVEDDWVYRIVNKPYKALLIVKHRVGFKADICIDIEGMLNHLSKEQTLTYSIDRLKQEIKKHLAEDETMIGKFGKILIPGWLLTDFSVKTQYTCADVCGIIKECLAVAINRLPENVIFRHPTCEKYGQCIEVKLRLSLLSEYKVISIVALPSPLGKQ